MHPRPGSGITQTRYASAWWHVHVSRRWTCSSCACKERGVSGLTIRSSRARFAASALAGYDLTIANAAQRPGLAQALALMKKPLALVFSALALSGTFASAATNDKQVSEIDCSMETL